MRGPIDFILVGFEGNNFKGEVLHALSEAIEKQIIDLLALSVIRKDHGGVVTTLDATKINNTILVDTKLHVPNNDLISDEDVEEAGDLLEDDTAAGLLVIEHLWAKPLKQALIDAGGVLVAEGRIHPDAAVELNNQA